jgi:hypothetical protein
MMIEIEVEVRLKNSPAAFTEGLFLYFHKDRPGEIFFEFHGLKALCYLSKISSFVLNSTVISFP